MLAQELGPGYGGVSLVVEFAIRDKEGATAEKVERPATAGLEVAGKGRRTPEAEVRVGRNV